MRRCTLMFSAAVMAAAFGATLTAQKTVDVHPGKGGSPHVRTEATIDGAAVSVEYGRPALKGRTPGKDIDPYEGKEWRTGADEQTTLVTNRALKFGMLAVPAGTYGLHTIPVKGQWQLIISKRPKGWGIPYPAGQDLGRVPMTMGKPPAAAERLTITLEDTATGGAMHIDWGTTRATIPFTVG
ncbi:MAG: DUF2911 domain-containing protein [Vicinamibacterales bacterium]